MHVVLTLLPTLAVLGAHSLPDPDWLVTQIDTPARVLERPESNELVLTNGLISRTFRLAPNAATVDLTNHNTETSILRGVKPEAVLVLDGERVPVGGLDGQPDYAYLDPAWLADMTASPDAFQFAGLSTGEPQARYPWQPKRHAPQVPWPPRGVALTLEFAAPAKLEAKYGGLRVAVHYELYQGIPALSKWVTVTNNASAEVALDGVEIEILAVNEYEKPRLHVESDYAFHTMVTTHWLPDAEYRSQTDYHYQSPILMVSKYPMGPGVVLKPGDAFESFRTFELLHDADDRERQGLALRRMMRTLAPQVAENPIFMHVRQSDSAALRLAIDQCADVGFEMVIMTFWSDFNIESEDPEYIARIKADVDYAHAKGVEVGGYTLMCASRDVGPEHNCISPETGQPGSAFGQSACLAGEWADGYFRRVLNFIDATGLDIVETDGPYHGDKCASTSHKHHRGLEDSQWRQWEACCRFYRECRKRGVYINTPDWYYLDGSNKCAMGYRESNFSLPRWRQILISRQNIFDATFAKTPSMGWMFVPLVEYHGGGQAATFEPLCDHLAEYEWHLAQNFGCGVQACYRGPRLYDTEETRAVVKKWVDFYRKHRAILDADIIHVRRADGRRLDCMMHVNALHRPRALAMVFNPTDHEQTDTMRLPLYYAGLRDKAHIREQEGDPKEYPLTRDYTVTVPLTLAAKSITWLLLE